jgi:hypothetical protein
MFESIRAIGFSQVSDAEAPKDAKGVGVGECLLVLYLLLPLLIL